MGVLVDLTRGKLCVQYFLRLGIEGFAAVIAPREQPQKKQDGEVFGKGAVRCGCVEKVEDCLDRSGKGLSWFLQKQAQRVDQTEHRDALQCRPAVDQCSKNSLGPEDQIVTPLILEPKRLTASQLEQDDAL